MTYSLCKTKALSDTMLGFIYWTLQNKFWCSSSKNQQFLHKKTDLKMSSTWWPFCLGVNVLFVLIWLSFLTWSKWTSMIFLLLIYMTSFLLSDIVLWPLHINHHSYPVIPGHPCHACDATQRILNYSIFWSMQQELFWQTYCISCLFDESQHDINTQYSWHFDRQCFKQKFISYLYVV